MFVTLGCIYQSSFIPHACKHAAPCRVNTGSLNWFRICSFQGTGAGSFSKALVGLSRLELPTSRLSGVRSNRLSYKPVCCFQHSLPTAWRRRDSNSRPPACKAGALPTELHPHRSGIHLLSHTVSSAVPSASWVLTVVFGMGTGVSPKRIDARNIVIQL